MLTRSVISGIITSKELLSSALVERPLSNFFF